MNKHQSIESIIIKIIAGEVLRVGESLPSIRQFAFLHNVSTTPVIEAYKNLEKFGLIESHPKSGFRVLTNDPAKLAKTLKALDVGDEWNFDEQVAAGMKVSELCDFSQPTIATGVIPVDGLFQNLTRSMRLFPHLMNAPVHGPDEQLLTTYLAKHMFSNKCIVTRKEVVVSETSILTPLMLSLRTCTQPGSPVAVASPCSVLHSKAITLTGRQAVYIKSSFPKGIDLDALEQALSSNREITCLMISTNSSRPFGITMSFKDKMALAEICEKYDITVIEDDSSGELFYDGERPIPLKHFYPDKTMYVSSFDDNVHPGARVNWVCPGQFTKEYRAQRDMLSCAPSPSVQNGLGMYMQTNLYSREQAAVRQRINKAIDTVAKKVHEHFPESTHVLFPSGGYNLCVKLPVGLSAAKLKQEAEGKGLLVSTEEFATLEESDSWIAINCSAVAAFAHRLDGVAKLGEIARKINETYSMGGE